MRSKVQSVVIAACWVLGSAAASSAQTVQMGKDMSLTFHGFISATGFAQDQNFAFGNGQNAEYPVPGETRTDRWFGGGDVRNTRLTMVFEGPKVVPDWKVGATLEMDFFGGFNGTGGFSGQQPNPRLRFAFVDFGNDSTTIRMGQFWSPLFANTAVSLSHLAFPLGYGSAGDIGWRFPGLFVFQKLTPKDAPVTADVEFAVQSGAWNAPGSTIDFGTAGNATWPQFELRVNLGGTAGPATWSGYVVGHVDQKDLSGSGSSTANDRLTGSAIEAGAKLQLGPVLFQGNGYTGRSIGQQFGGIAQFGKIKSSGGWVQVGFDVTKHWGIFQFWGIDDPRDSDVLAAIKKDARLKNIMYVTLLRWKSGPFSLGLEYMHSDLTSKTADAPQIQTQGQQIAFSTLFTF